MGTPGEPRGTETFGQIRLARVFKRDVEAAGHVWPDGFGTEFVRELTDIGPDPRQRYLSRIGRLARELQRIVGHTVSVADLTESHIRRWIKRPYRCRHEAEDSPS